MAVWGKAMDAAWEFIRRDLFCPETGLVYDYLSSREAAERFRFLPSPAEIALSFPNPCGWSTGMEDCALNAGFLLDVLRMRGELDGEFAARAVEGLLRLGTAHGRRGFVARGLSPFDGKSCYGNSSRDQFTLAVYGLLVYWRGADARSRLRGAAAEALAAVADYCETSATPVNAYNLRRLDGGRAIVSGVWHCDPHEAFRLPMIFAAAHEATGKAKYLELVRRFAVPGLAQSRRIDPAAEHWWDMPLAQMQISFRSFLDGGAMPELSGELRELLRLGADIARRKLLALLDEAERFDGRWDVLCGNWRTLPMRLTAETLSPDGGSALFDGRTYLNPCFAPAFHRPLEFIRGLGNYLGSMALAEGISFADPLFRRVGRLIGGIDFSRSASVAPLPLLHAYLLARRAGADPGAEAPGERLQGVAPKQAARF